MEFLGRKDELELLKRWKADKNSKISVIYGRRRVGKTRLVEEACRNEQLLKFEGLEKRSTPEQQKNFLSRFAELTQKPEYRYLQIRDWKEILILLSRHLGKKPAVVFLDEFQWLAAGRTRLVSDLKYVWDNYFLKQNRVHLVLCGSISSFMIKKVVRSNSLYGRVALEIDLQPIPFSAIERARFFTPRRSIREIVELYMAMGGIPQYLEMIDSRKSVRLNLLELCFSRHGYLVREFDRIFVSHFSRTQHYRSILLELARRGHASRKQLEKACGLASGGRTGTYLEELEMAGFVEHYFPVLKANPQRRGRYRISDPYIVFYFTFIRTNLNKILQADGPAHISNFLPEKTYAAWCGRAFEHFCLRHHHLLADVLGFRAINYHL